jgi:hypothetical protein
MEVLRMQLTNKERAYLFECAFTDSDALEVEYSDRFKSLDISKNEFDEMNANQQMRYAKILLLQRAYRKYDKILQEIEITQEKETEFMKTALPILYNNPENKDIYPELTEIKPLVKTTVDKYFAKEDLWRELHEIATFENSSDRQVALIAEALRAVILDKMEIKRCEADDCNQIFHPAPQGSEQKYCSVRCRDRIAKRKYRKKQNRP